MLFPPFGRYRQIIQVMAKYGFADLAEELGFERLIPRGMRRPHPEAPVDAGRALNLRLALEELGPTYVKLGQILSTRPDLLSAEYIRELENLQDNLPPFPYEQAKAIVERELGCPLTDIFEIFYEEPIASASLAQVHEAILPSGEAVVVKIQRPDVEPIVQRDMPALRSLVRFIEGQSERARIYDASGIVRELERTLHAELDFTKERFNMEVLAQNLTDFPRIKVPKVYPEYSTRRVLVMERVFGQKPDGTFRDPALAAQFLRSFLKQFAVDGYFHADPHPGNVMVTREGDLYLVDLGMVGYLDSRTRRGVTKILLAMIGRRGDTAAEVLVELGEPETDFRLNDYRLEVGRLVSRFHNTPLSELRVGEVLTEALRAGFRTRLKFHSQLTLLVKALVQIDGIARALDPQADFLDILQPDLPLVVRTQAGQLISPSNALHTGLESIEVTLDLPRKLNLLLDKINADNRIRIQFEHIALEQAFAPFGKWINRLVLAVVFASLSLASAIIISTEVGPKWFGYSILGLLGYVAAFMLGLYLVYTIVRTHVR